MESYGPPDSREPPTELIGATGHGRAPIEAAAAPPSARVGKFVRTEELGSGGTSEVWKAWDTELQRWVALKFLRSADAEETARFQREALIAARLSHPNIAAIFEVGAHEGRPFIAMQYIAGRTLAGEPPGDPRIAVRLLRDAARAVHHAKELGIVHRDLKPGNLMIEGERLYVLDFGRSGVGARGAGSACQRRRRTRRRRARVRGRRRRGRSGGGGWWWRGRGCWWRGWCWRVRTGAAWSGRARGRGRGGRWWRRTRCGGRGKRAGVGRAGCGAAANLTPAPSVGMT